MTIFSFFSHRVFLVRDSQSNPRTFVLSLSHGLKIKHFQIVPVSIAIKVMNQIFWCSVYKNQIPWFCTFLWKRSFQTKSHVSHENFIFLFGISTSHYDFGICFDTYPDKLTWDYHSSFFFLCILQGIVHISQNLFFWEMMDK